MKFSFPPCIEQVDCGIINSAEKFAKSNTSTKSGTPESCHSPEFCLYSTALTVPVEPLANAIADYIC